MIKDEKPNGIASAGGKARAAKLTADERSAIARQAAAKRWETTELPSDLPVAVYGSTDRPLRFGEVEIPCYVLDDKRRVLVQRALQTSIGMSTSGGSDGAQRLALFIEGLARKGVDCNDLAVRIRSPIIFRFMAGGKPAYGYEATIINDICDAVLEARRSKALAPQQMHFAKQCELLLRGLARVGIIDLVDRATGYDKVRFRENFEEVIERFIAKELRPWIKTFPDDYYEQIFRLNNWEYEPTSTKRPGIVGHWTNDLAYARLAPGVLEELHKLTPRDEKGRLKHKLTQRLTGNVGHPKLKERMAAIVALMRASTSWKGFYLLIDRALPRYDTTLQLPFSDVKAMEKIQISDHCSAEIIPANVLLPPLSQSRNPCSRHQARAHPQSRPWQCGRYERRCRSRRRGASRL